MKQFAVQVPFDNDGWLYVVDEKSQPVLYDRFKDAINAGSIWKKCRIMIFKDDQPLNREFIIDTKDYIVFKDLNNDDIHFEPKHKTWRHLQKCFEVAYQWGYEQYQNSICKTFSVLYDVDPNSVDTSSVKLILRN